MKSIPSLANVETDPAAEPKFIGTATYCPEDDKLRLYVGRVPREDYLALKAEGWTSTPKQSCDFVAVWTPERNRTAILFAGVVEDEDQGPEDRAADRAERFAGYLDKRAAEAGMHADRYDAGPAVHGFQDYGKAVKSADRHDRLAGRAVDAWEKAEYWQRRTAGVISHRLYLSSPAVRMGRIKTIEAEIRQIESYYTPSSDSRIMQPSRYGDDQTPVPHVWCGLGRGGHWVAEKHLEGIKASYTQSLAHLQLRLAYETQMLEAQGGRAAFVEMEVGGWIGSKQIRKVNKSSATGRVVSVEVMGTTSGFTKESGYKEHKTWACPVLVNVERMATDSYRAPTDEDKKAMAATLKAEKAALPKKDPCPLVNPTDEDAERLQEALNERAKDDLEAREIRAYGKAYTVYKPSTICRIPQAVYSANSKGNYARAETRGLCRNMELEPRESNMYSSHEKAEAMRRGPKVCEIRTTSSDGSDYGARRVIIITDKPQKPLPAAVWAKAPEVSETVTA